MDKPMKGIDTRLIHAGEPEPRIEGAVSMPIFQSSTFEYRGEDSYYALRYIRLNNTPNHVALHRKLAAIEGAEAALVTASGMAAVATTLMTIAGAGERMMAQDCLYGGTHDLMRVEFPRHEYRRGFRRWRQRGVVAREPDAGDPRDLRRDHLESADAGGGPARGGRVCA